MTWTSIRDETRKSRKPRQCILCEDAIAVGETYVARTGIGDDGRVTVAMHVDCEGRTRDWSIDDWESNDAYEMRGLREEKKSESDYRAG